MAKYLLAPWVWHPDAGPFGAGFWGPPTARMGSLDLRGTAQRTDTVNPQGFGLHLVADAVVVPQGGFSFPTGAWNLTIRTSWRDALSLASIPTSITGANVILETLTEFADPTGENFVAPLMPNRSLNMAFRLGAITASRAMTPADYVRSCFHLRLRVARLLQRVVDGELPIKVVRKFVGGLCIYFRKQFTSWPDFVPDALQGAFPGPLEPETVFFDDFNRADAPDLGPNYIDYSGDWQVVSNQASTIPNSLAIVQDNDLSTSDNYAQITPSFGALVGLANANINAACRVTYDGPSTSYYLVQIDSGTLSTDFSAGLYVGTLTGATLLDGPVNITSEYGDGRVLRCQASGANIKAFYDGAEILSATDSTYATGLTGFMGGQGDLATLPITVDSFEMGDLVTSVASGGLYGVRSQATSLSGGLYQVRANNSGASGGLYVVKANNAPASGGIYEVRSQASGDGTAIYSVKSLAATASGGVYLTKSLSDAVAQSLYLVRANNMQSAEGLYAVIATASSAANSLYCVKSSTLTESGGLYQVIGKVALVGGGLYWAQATQFSVTAVGIYDVLESALVPSGGLYSVIGQSTPAESGGIYQINASFLSEHPGLYYVKGSTLATTAALYEVLGRSSTTTVTIYNVIARVTADSGGVYSVVAQASAIAAGLYSVIQGSLFVTATGLYEAKGAATVASGGIYEVKASTNTASGGLYSIRIAPIAVPAGGLYSVIAGNQESDAAGLFSVVSQQVPAVAQGVYYVIQSSTVLTPPDVPFRYGWVANHRPFVVMLKRRMDVGDVVAEWPIELADGATAVMPVNFAQVMNPDDTLDPSGPVSATASGVSVSLAAPHNDTDAILTVSGGTLGDDYEISLYATTNDGERIAAIVTVSITPPVECDRFIGKSPLANLWNPLNFRRLLGPNVLLDENVTPDVSVSPAILPADLLASFPTVDADKAFVILYLTAGVAGEDYTITVSATDTLGAVHVVNAVCRVRPE